MPKSAPICNNPQHYPDKVKAKEMPGRKLRTAFATGSMKVHPQLCRFMGFSDVPFEIWYQHYGFQRYFEEVEMKRTPGR